MKKGLLVGLLIMCVALALYAVSRGSFSGAHFGNPDIIRQDMDLYKAAENGDLKTVQSLVGRGRDVNFVCVDTCKGWTPLMIAAANGHADVVKFLLTNGADPNAQNGKGRTAIGFATRYRFVPIVEMLLDYGANPALLTPDDNGAWSPMADALVGSITEQSAYDILKIFVQRTGNVNFMYNDYTPLLMAVLYDDYDFAKYLLENGADVNHVKVIKDAETGQDVMYSMEVVAKTNNMLELIRLYKH